MAIYHFSVKNISRSDGRSAVACSAYRSGEKLIDERQGKEQDYTKKTGVELKKIYAPENTNPELLDRNQLWNIVEKVENRKNSQLAREFEIAFPHELNQQQREQMLNELCQDIIKRHGVVVDAAIHAPHTANGSDERNYHAHIMFTTRSIDEHGNLGKKTREFNDNGKQEVEFWRESFADLANKHLARAGYLTEVDHRSYANQDNGLQATIHEGSKVTQLRRQGIDTEISLKNDAIKAQNSEKLVEIINGLEQEIIATEKTIAKLRTESPHSHEKTKYDMDVHNDNKNRLERKPEQSSTTFQDIPTSEKQIAVQLFKTKIQDLAQQIHEKELKTIINQMSEYIETSKKLLDQIETHRNNKPFNPFKLKAWEGELANLVHQHDNEIKAKYDHLKTEHQRIKNRGVVSEHWQKAESLIQQKYPDEYKKIKQLERELNEKNATVSIARTQEQDNGRGR